MATNGSLCNPNHFLSIEIFRAISMISNRPMIETRVVSLKRLIKDVTMFGIIALSAWGKMIRNIVCQ